MGLNSASIAPLHCNARSCARRLLFKAQHLLQCPSPSHTLHLGGTLASPPLERAILPPCKYQIHLPTHFLNPPINPSFVRVMIVEPMNVYRASGSSWSKTSRFSVSYFKIKSFQFIINKFLLFNIQSAVLSRTPIGVAMCAARAFLSCITSSLLQKSGHKLQVSGHDFDSYPILIKGQEEKKAVCRT